MQDDVNSKERPFGLSERLCEAINLRATDKNSLSKSLRGYIWLDKAFYWSESPEGHTFWSRVHDRLVDGATDFTDEEFSKLNMPELKAKFSPRAAVESIKVTVEAVAVKPAAPLAPTCPGLLAVSDMPHRLGTGSYLR